MEETIWTMVFDGGKRQNKGKNGLLRGGPFSFFAEKYAEKSRRTHNAYTGLFRKEITVFYKIRRPSAQGEKAILKSGGRIT